MSGDGSYLLFMSFHQISFFLVISIFSLKSQYEIPLVHISRQGLQYLPTRSIHTSGHCVYFKECILTKTHLMKKALAFGRKKKKKIQNLLNL